MLAIKIRKAIIPAAGMGTRFLPATKAMPKEMLPIVDKPTIQYIVEEAVAAGIEEILIVTGKGKRAIEDHFDASIELEQTLLSKGKLDLLQKVQEAHNMVDIHYIRQKEPRGLGHAVWCARKFIGNEPFAILLGDDIVRSEQPCIRQLMDQYEKFQGAIVGVQEVDWTEVSRYGIIDPKPMTERLSQVNRMVEKPAKSDAPSNLAIMGRYVLTPRIFEMLETAEPGAGGEIQLTDAIQKLSELEKVYGYRFEGRRYDVGEKLGFITTSIEFALGHEDLRLPLLKKMESILADSRKYS